MPVEFGYDVTNGVIVGDPGVKYEFWQENEILHRNHIKKENGSPIMDLVARDHFCNDQEAIEWFAANYPAEYADRKERPIEMRVYDQPGKLEQAMIDARKAQGG